jgi:hypothetical protein
MNKSLALVLVAALLVAAPALASSLTVISGTVKDASSTPVSGATVAVTCNGNLKTTTTGLDGKYYVTYPQSKCKDGNTVSIHATKDDMSGDGTGTVEGGVCIVNSGFVDVTIPEFGVVAASVAFVGAIAGFLILRKKN